MWRIRQPVSHGACNVIAAARGSARVCRRFGSPIDVAQSRLAANSVSSIASHTSRRGFATTPAAPTAPAASSADRAVGTTLPTSFLLSEAEQRTLLASGSSAQIRNFSIIAHIDHGKCWGAGTQMMLYAGGVKPVEKIVAGDMLMGDDSTPRTVRAGTLHAGHTADDARRAGDVATPPCTYLVTSDDSSRAPWTCNGDHILVLRVDARPTRAQQADGQQAVCTYALESTVDANSTRLVATTRMFPNVDESDAYMRSWAAAHPVAPIWEVSAQEFVAYPTEVRQRCRQFMPASVEFAHDDAEKTDSPASQALSLAARLHSSLVAVGLQEGDRPITPQLIDDTAWILGVWAATRGTQIAPNESASLGARINAWIADVTGGESHTQEDARRLLAVNGDRDSADNDGSLAGALLRRILSSYAMSAASPLPLPLLTVGLSSRRALLAGLLDGAAEYRCDTRDFSLHAPAAMSEGVTFLGRSLGMSVHAASTTNVGRESRVEMQLKGRSIVDLPTAVHATSDTSADVITTDLDEIDDSRFSSIAVTRAPHAAYFGFEVDGNGRFLMADFTVTHNSTLADRLLESAGNIRALSKEDAQVLDNLQVERDRGITVKAQTATMFYRDPRTGLGYILNLIDTPGHVDFSYEAQTLANYYTAMDADLDIIPVLSKIDLPHSDVKAVGEQIQVAFDMDPSSALPISSKTGLGIDAVFQAIIDRIRPPESPPATVDPLSVPLRALVFDSWFDIHRGVICLVKIVDGSIRKGDKVASWHGDAIYDVQEVGLMMGRGMRETEALHTGQVGYLIAGIKNAQTKPSGHYLLGETFYKIGSRKGLNRTQVTTSLGVVENHATANIASSKAAIEPLPGFQPARSMVFAGLFPSGSGDFESLHAALEKLLLNDPSVIVERETSQALGLGFRCGFLGVLHMDVFSSRLETDFGSPVIITAPTVPYQAVMKDGTTIKIDSPSKFPEDQLVDHYLEPMVKATIIAPASYLGDLVDLCNSHRGQMEEMVHLTATRISLRYKLPLSEIVVDFYDRIKTVSSGYASFDYDESGYEIADIVKLDLRLNGEPVDALCAICDRTKAEIRARKLTAKLREKIDRQNFEVVIQAAIGTRILARERIAPYRKDVLTKSGKTVGGGDQSRKKKLLEKQKQGKRRMKAVGNVELSEEVNSDELGRRTARLGTPNRAHLANQSGRNSHSSCVTLLSYVCVWCYRSVRTAGVHIGHEAEGRVIFF